MDNSLIVEQFERDGYMVIDRLIPPDILASQLNFLKAQIAKTYPSDFRPLHEDNPYTGLRDVSYAAEISQVLKRSGVLDLLLGPTQFLRLPPGGRAVHPNHSGALGPVHQDGRRLGGIDKFVTAWVPFVEIDEECGGLGLFPSLGHSGEVPEGPNGIDVGSADPLPVYMSPGDVLIFHRWMPHKSMPNTSSRVRYSMDMRFYSTLTHMRKMAIDLQEGKIVYPPGYSHLNSADSN